MSSKNKGRTRTRSVIFKVLSWAFGIPLALIAIAALACVWLHATADLGEPEFVPSQVPVVQVNDSLRRWGSSSLRIDPDGLYEMRVCGGPFERGEAIGKLGADLLYQQEKAFADKLFEMVPSSRYRAFLHYFITIFNRRLGASVPLEYRQEIKAMSASCTHEFDDFGSPYERQMQYHSAHDIGHVMQDYMLVGCTSFAVWGRESADSSLLMARNFDFYMGEEFAKNKLVLFEKPDSGYAYVSVTWPGMLGVVSGMNTEGLAVTINASKLEVPSSSATPISILVKSILQYASNIEEAEKIAASFKTFVCESILVGSANDGRAVIIEKTPSAMDVYSTGLSSSHKMDSSLGEAVESCRRGVASSATYGFASECGPQSGLLTASSSESSVSSLGEAVTRVICTNHYQSDRFRNDPVNVENIRVSDSGYRYRRVQQLLDSLGTIDYLKAAAVLRDIRGVDGENVGYCNDLSINQMLAMHSVIFKPAEKKIWVSTSPWQFGKFVCFDLDKVFGEEICPREFRLEVENKCSDEEYYPGNSPKVDEAKIDGAMVDRDSVSDDSVVAAFIDDDSVVNAGFSDEKLSIPADKFLETETFRNILKFKAMQQSLESASKSRREVPADSLALFVSWNPSYYGTYVAVATYLESLGKNAEADEYYRRALTCPMKLSERQHLETRLNGR